WLDMSVWEEGGLPAATDWRIVKHELEELEGKLLGRECYGGLDLARVNDLSAFVLVFPPTLDDDLGVLADKWIVLSRFFIPEDDILRRVRRDRVPYDVWRDQGFLTATPGNATDFAFIEAELLELASRHDLRELSYDRTFAGEIVQHLQDEGLNLAQFGQGCLSWRHPRRSWSGFRCHARSGMAAIPCCDGTPPMLPCAMIRPATSSRTRNAPESASTALSPSATRSGGRWPATSMPAARSMRPAAS